MKHSLSNETVTAIMMFNKNTKAVIRTPDDDADFSDIVVGVLQGHTFIPHLFINCLDYALWTSIDLIKENVFS